MIYRTLPVAFAFLFFLLLSARQAAADTLVVTTPNAVFTPQHVMIPIGDTIEWRKSTFFGHTVASGTGSGDTNVGTLFDAPLEGPGARFWYTFNDTAGVYPYFCRVHELMLMNGTVTVVNPATGVAGRPPTIAATWSELKELFVR